MKRELGIFERAQYISDRHAPFHIVTVLRLENAPPSHIVRKALTLLQKRHPFLSARLMHEKGHHYFATLVNPPLPFRNPPRWNNDDWHQVVEVELASASDEPFFDRETLALDQIARGAAGALVTSILEGF